MGMIERSNGLGFVLESVGKQRSRNFDGHDAIQSRIVGSVHSTHAADADLGLHDVRS
jgi:hypothetical protein